MNLYYLERALMAGVDLWFRWIPRMRPSRAALEACKIVSHRGEHDNRRVFENTLAAFDAAAAAGCWGLEFDVRWTRDLQPVVVHDPDLRRVFGIDLKIADIELSELRQRAPQVPTLLETIERYGGQHHLMMELKPDNLRAIKARSECLGEMFRPLEAGRDYHVLVLDTGLLDLAEFCPPRAMLPVAELNVDQLSREALGRGFAGICSHFLLMSQSRIREHHRQRQQLGTGFPASRYALYREINRGVDWIFTNHAVQLSSLRRSLLDQSQPD